MVEVRLSGLQGAILREMGLMVLGEYPEEKVRFEDLAKALDDIPGLWKILRSAGDDED